jgi:myo-inositol-1(or 4)-monophosphatase
MAAACHVAKNSASRFLLCNSCDKHNRMTILSTQRISDLTDFAEYLAVEAGHAILPHFRQSLIIDDKEAHSEKGWDPVTEGDRAAELAIRKLITEHYPEHDVHGEEFGRSSKGSDFTWVLDPIDGTRAFVIGMPTWATLVGLYYRGKPLLGVMRQPFVEESFIGNPSGAWLDHRGDRRKLTSSKKTKIADAQVGTTAPQTYRDPQSINGLAALSSRCKSVRYGGDAYFFALVAAGHLDVALDCGVQVYDIAALIPIIEGAGGVVSGWNNPNPHHGGNFVAAGNRDLLDATLACFE